MPDLVRDDGSQYVGDIDPPAHGQLRHAVVHDGDRAGAGNGQPQYVQAQAHVLQGG